MCCVHEDDPERGRPEDRCLGAGGHRLPLEPGVGHRLARPHIKAPALRKAVAHLQIHGAEMGSTSQNTAEHESAVGSLEPDVYIYLKSRRADTARAVVLGMGSR
jgi:hypothetical protein